MAVGSEELDEGPRPGELFFFFFFQENFIRSSGVSRLLKSPFVFPIVIPNA